jgi:multiple sugar transport system ATP-binding protein
VTLGVRPEHIRLTRGAGAGMTGRVVLVEPVGAVTYVDVEIGAVTLKASTDPADELSAGETVAVEFNPRRVLFFDTAAGHRLRAA